MSTARPLAPRWWPGAMLVLALWASPVPAAEIYRWVDRQGVTHYGSTPPPGVKASGVAMAPAPSADAASQARARASQEKAEADRLAAERTRALSQRQLQDMLARQSPGSRVQRCAAAREQLDQVNRGGPVFRLDDKGQRVWLPDAQRDGEIARLRAEVAEQCTPGDTAQDAATRQRMADSERQAQCEAARAAVRDAGAPAARVPESEIERARERARQICGAAP